MRYEIQDLGMPRNKSRQKALAALTYDLFTTESIVPIAPATMDTRIKQERQPTVLTDIRAGNEHHDKLPAVEELYRMFDQFNLIYFEGKLPSVKIDYSNRMFSAGSYTPSLKLIKIGRKYHELFPGDLPDTLKHEMIHIRHFNHDATFKAEAKRIGAAARARSHPSLRREPRFIYECPSCRKQYPRQKRLVLSSCGDCSSKRKYDKRHKLRLLLSSKRKPNKVQ